MEYDSHQTRFWYRDQADAQAFFTFAARNDIEAAIYPGANPGLTHTPGEPGFIVSLGQVATHVWSATCWNGETQCQYCGLTVPEYDSAVREVGLRAAGCTWTDRADVTAHLDRVARYDAIGAR